MADGVGRIRMRVHERGSGETLSCGTGAAAAALATREWAGEGAPDTWRVEVPGGVVGVPRRPTAHVHLSGPAELVYSGTIDGLTSSTSRYGSSIASVIPVPERCRTRSTRYPLLRRGAQHGEVVRQLGLQPAVQRVRAEVALHDEPGVRPGLEPRQPVQQHVVQLVLADPDRRVRPDRREFDVGGNILGQAGVDVGEAEVCGVAAHQIQRTLVDIHRPHRGVGGLEGEGEGDRTPAAAEVEQVAAGRRGGRVARAGLRCRRRCARG